MPKLVIVDDMDVVLAQGHVAEVCEDRAGCSLLPVGSTSFEVPAEFFAYQWVDGVDDALAGLPSYEERVAYCRDNLELLASFHRKA
ncbi:hypothetical protein A7D27_06385 [Pseudomonas sp. 1D4]|uniref:hypothetical protein n=1 Tax=Pseudomonadaceae TaxID=135621 RepID=UPI00084BC257|nr:MULTISPECIES: hypothetical protein [Pseudomonas]OEC44945.1 hypothetical protein A7D27_06385 [Pseudomonas sp. 1D4]